MRERPPLSDGALAATLADGWGVVAASLEFLPVGDDSRAWSFRVVADDARCWFLKVRRSPIDPAAVAVPGFLRDHGLDQVVAAVPARDGDPWRRLDGFTLLLYPWIDGVPAMERGLTGRQWAELGKFVAALHRTRLPAALAATGPRLVLCHADLHTANLLVEPDDRLLVVDWDGVQLAPAERDLLFPVTEQERTRFFDGYGPVTLDPAVVAYYRWEWVVQELADYGSRVLEGRLGEDTRRHALEEFRRLFAAGDVVEAARAADRELELR